MMAAAATVILSAFLLFFGETLFRLFTDDEAVVSQGLIMLRLLVPTYITYICIEIFSGAVRGAGDSLIPTLMTLTGVCLIRILWVCAIAPSYHSMPVVLLSYPITWLATSCMFLIYYWKGGWLRRCVQRAGLGA